MEDITRHPTVFQNNPQLGTVSVPFSIPWRLASGRAT